MGLREQNERRYLKVNPTSGDRFSIIGKAHHIDDLAELLAEFSPERETGIVAGEDSLLFADKSKMDEVEAILESYTSGEAPDEGGEG